MKTTKVFGNASLPFNLYTDDNFTLAFEGMVESTPAELRAWVNEDSLNKLLGSEDRNISAKAEKALSLRLQLSAHGAGRKSAQVFSDEGLILDQDLSYNGPLGSGIES
jgi:hypothetical protein